MSRSIVALIALLSSSTALAEDTQVWEGVYNRSGKTVKAGEWMGIGGGVAMIGGAVAVGTGFGQTVGGIGTAFGGDGGEGISQGATNIGGGLVVGLTGLGIYTIGPALMAGGGVRQAKAIRQVNPEAPRPWYGYATWVLWSTGLNGGAWGILTAGTLGYVTGAMQKGKNRMNWDRATANRLEYSTPSTFTVDVTPFEYEGSKGLALVGTF